MRRATPYIPGTSFDVYFWKLSTYNCSKKNYSNRFCVMFWHFFILAGQKKNIWNWVEESTKKRFSQMATPYFWIFQKFSIERWVCRTTLIAKIFSSWIICIPTCSYSENRKRFSNCQFTVKTKLVRIEIQWGHNL